MATHWFVVANQKQAKIFIENRETHHLQFFQSLKNPLGDETRRSLIRKESGQGLKSVGTRSAVRYTEGKRHDPVEMASLQFARSICDYLRGEKMKNSFLSLTMIAEPHFMGKLRAQMPSALQEHVVDWVNKDLLKTPQDKLSQMLLHQEPATK